MPNAFVYMTASSMEEAEKIADKLVSEHLCACVNILPGLRSVYRWKGVVERAEEVALIGKTREILVPLVVEAVKSVHSYEVPAVASWPIGRGNPDFLRWIEEETRGPLHD